MRWVTVEHIEHAASFVGRPIDEFTTRAPHAPPLARLEVERPRQAAGVATAYVETGLEPLFTPKGNLVFRGLRPPRQGQPWSDRYRVVLEADDRVPFYPSPGGFGFELSAAQPIARMRLPLLPGASYPYPTHLRVARGVITKAGKPLVSAIVSLVGSVDRCATDNRGAFALCLRAAPTGQPLTLSVAAEGEPTVSRTIPSPAEAARTAVLVDIQQ